MWNHLKKGSTVDFDHDKTSVIRTGFAFFNCGLGLFFNFYLFIDESDISLLFKIAVGSSIRKYFHDITVRSHKLSKIILRPLLIALNFAVANSWIFYLAFWTGAYIFHGGSVKTLFIILMTFFESLTRGFCEKGSLVLEQNAQKY